MPHISVYIGFFQKSQETAATTASSNNPTSAIAAAASTSTNLGPFLPQATYVATSTVAHEQEDVKLPARMDLAEKELPDNHPSTHKKMKHCASEDTMSEEFLSSDYAIALAMQQELDLYDAQQVEAEELRQHLLQQELSNTGKAVSFVEAVLALQRRLTEPPGDPNLNFHNFANVAVDDMVWQAERLFAKQEEFRIAQKPTHIDIGYHYTKRLLMHDIKVDGLLTRQERTQSGIDSNFNGATFGDGVYTADNPYSYWEFAGGDIGLFVLRLKGETRSYDDTCDDDADTVLGRTGDTDQVTVLKSSAQCMAPVQFGSGLVSLHQDIDVGNQMVYKYHVMLQELVDEHFNEGCKTFVTELRPSQVTLRMKVGASASASPSSAVASSSTAAVGVAAVTAAAAVSTNTVSSKVIQYTAPDTLEGTGRLAALQNVDSTLSIVDVNKKKNNDCLDCCAVCLDAMSHGTTLARIQTCGHIFHRNCIQDCFVRSNKCPVCRQSVSEPVGKCPSGQMSITHREDLTCSGYEDDDSSDGGTIVITYNIPAGIQKSYHDHPGLFHTSAYRVAYIPNCEQGRALLARLEYAFLHGLTFTVGVSLTTGCPNAVTWASIHHKTRVTAGPHGYPDPYYFDNVNEELDALDVPRLVVPQPHNVI
jgi:hypothetical protein